MSSRLFKSMRSQGMGHVFDDPKVLEEMLSLRKKGYSFTEIGNRFGVDHTTVHYHCKKWGLNVSREQRAIVFKLFSEKCTIDDVVEKTGFPRTVIELCHTHYQQRSGTTRSKRVEKLPKLPVVEMFEYNMETVETIHRRLIKVDDRGVEWRKDEQGKLICLGKSNALRKVDAMQEKKRALEEKRLKMLKY